MSYFPYVKGEFYDLYAFRDTADLLARRSFTPIIEPVNDILGALARTVQVLNDASVTPIVVVNPGYGSDDDYHGVMSSLSKEIKCNNKYTVGLRLHDKMCPELVLETCKILGTYDVALIHSGFIPSNGFVDKMMSLTNVTANIFILEDCGRLYVKKFNNFRNKILVRDGVRIRDGKNDYPESEFFSDLHITFEDEKANGFGDYLTMGKNGEYTDRNFMRFSIHLTFLDAERDNAMFMYHFFPDEDMKFISTSAMFLNALSKLFNIVDNANQTYYETEALRIFRRLNDKQHCPGLGYIHQVSMMHHIETLAYHRTIG